MVLKGKSNEDEDNYKKEMIYVLESLLILSGYLIADESEGENISIPSSIKNAIDECHEKQEPNTIINLSYTMLNVGKLLLTSKSQSHPLYHHMTSE